MEAKDQSQFFAGGSGTCTWPKNCRRFSKLANKKCQRRWRKPLKSALRSLGSLGSVGSLGSGSSGGAEWRQVALALSRKS